MAASRPISATPWGWSMGGRIRAFRWHQDRGFRSSYLSSHLYFRLRTYRLGSDKSVDERPFIMAPSCFL